MIVERPGQNKLVGLYRGKVLRHLQGGKLKVFVPSVYPPDLENRPEALPDAEQLVPLFGGNNTGNGVFSYPNVGAVVICQFMNGDQNYPIVIGATQGSHLSGIKYGEVADELDPSTGKVPSAVHMVSCGKAKVKLYEGGQIEMQVIGSEGNAQVILDTRGNVFIDADNLVQIRAKDIKLIASDQVMTVAGKSVLNVAGDQVYSQAKDINIAATDGHVLVTSSENRTGKMI